MNNKPTKFKYRQVYEHYVTHLFGDQHNLKTIKVEYNKVYWLWRSHLYPFIKNLKKEKTRVLDLGCGLGHNMYFFQQVGFKNTYGVDLSRENIDVLKKQGLKGETGNIFQYLQKTKNKFTIISMFDVIEHFTLNESLRLLKLIKKKLDTNGLIIIQTTNANHPFASQMRYDDITHEVIFSKQSLKELLSLAGYRHTEIFTVNSFYLWHPQPLVRWLRITLFQAIASLTEIFYRLLAATQGVILKECKPVLIAIVYKTNLSSSICR